MSKDKNKKKKEKVTYVDDGRTICDMSSLGGGNRGFVGKGTWKDRTRTYFAAVKQMFIPMLVTIGVICVVFGILWVILTLAE